MRAAVTVWMPLTVFAVISAALAATRAHQALARRRARRSAPAIECCDLTARERAAFRLVTTGLEPGTGGGEYR